MSLFSEIGELYTPLSVALEELKKRKTDAELIEKVNSFFAGCQNPPGFTDAPVAVMAPALFSPNLELSYFFDIRKELPMKTLLYEYQGDKFVHLNFEKRHLANMVFYTQEPGGYKTVTDSQRVVDFQKYQGKPMSQLETLSGENFIEFHHRLCREYFKQDIEIRDFSDWFASSYKYMPEYPYLRYLSLFIKDAILFGNFTTSKYETQFTSDKVLPAFRKLKELFGVAPLIVPIEPPETDDAGFGCYYPEEVKAFI